MSRFTRVGKRLPKIAIGVSQRATARRKLKPARSSRSKKLNTALRKYKKRGLKVNPLMRFFK